MKKNYSKKDITLALENCRYSEVLSSLGIPFFLIKYERGERLSSPLNSELYFQIVLSGDLSIYFVRNDGSAYSLSTGGEGLVLGEMELFQTNSDSVFAEALSPVLTIACDISIYKDELLNNLSFVQFIASLMANKIKAITNQNAIYSSLSDRVINYICYKCSDKTLRGVEKAAFKLHCSPRQLQRILNSFVNDGRLTKLGKGCYKMLL